MNNQPTLFDTLRRYRVPLVITAVLAVVAVAAYLLWRQFFTLYVFSTTPTTFNAVPYLTPVLTLNLNKPVSDKELSISAPDGVAATYVVHGNSVDINIFTNIDVNKTYTFTINRLASTDGHILTGKKITFTTSDSTDITAAEQKLILDRQLANKPVSQDDPVLQALPYTGSDFSAIGYLDPSSDGKGIYSVIVTVFVPADDTDDPSAASVVTAKADAAAYLRTISGYNDTKYITLYKIQGYGG